MVIYMPFYHHIQTASISAMAEVSTKTCTRCAIRKPLEEFASRDRTVLRCASCRESSTLLDRKRKRKPTDQLADAYANKARHDDNDKENASPHASPDAEDSYYRSPTAPADQRQALRALQVNARAARANREGGRGHGLPLASGRYLATAAARQIRPNPLTPRNIRNPIATNTTLCVTPP